MVFFHSSLRLHKALRCYEIAEIGSVFIGGRVSVLAEADKAQLICVAEHAFVFKGGHAAVQVCKFAIDGKLGRILAHKAQENILRRQELGKSIEHRY